VSRRHEQFEAWACRFPSLRGAPGVAPWDPEVLDAWATGPTCEPPARHAVRFLLWNWGGTWEVGAFDALAALVWWDAHHREIFVYWLTAHAKQGDWHGDAEQGAHLDAGRLLDRELTEGAVLELCTDSGWLKGSFLQVDGKPALRVRLAGRTTKGAEASPAVVLPLPETSLLRWPSEAGG